MKFVDYLNPYCITTCIVLWNHIWCHAEFYLKFLTWSSTPIRDKALLTALTYVTACLDEPQFTSARRTQV